MAFDDQTPNPSAVGKARRNRQVELLRLLDGGNEPAQWIALKELSKMGDKAAADRIFRYADSPSPDLRTAAQAAYRQIQEREAAVGGAPLPPPVEPRIQPPPPPQAPPPVVESADPVFGPADFGQDDGRTEPLPVEGEPFGAPVTDAEEAALLPSDDIDRGLLPQ